MPNTVETKTFKVLYPDYATFKASVVDSVLRLGNTFKGGLPAYLDDTKTFYNMETLYIFFMNKYGDFAAVDEDDRQNALMINALLDTLPALYTKTMMLNTEALNLITPEGLLANIEKRYNEDPDKNYASTETAYSSTPGGDQAVGTFDVNKTKEKNVINRKDATVRIKETSNLVAKLKELAEANVSGFIYEFINSIEFSSMWVALGGDGQVVVITGKDGVDGAPGKDGAPGAPGIDGKDGAPGRDGTDGKDGAPGAKGDKGDTGSSIVAKGSVPTKADLPADAITGDAWVVTDETKVYVLEGGVWVDFGPAGSTGPAGKDGTDGTPGKDGEKGDKGDPGQDGLPGTNGTNGANGKDGADGAPGAPGKDGADAVLPTWTEINDLWTNPDKFEKYKDKDIRIFINPNDFDNITDFIKMNNFITTTSAEDGTDTKAFVGSRFDLRDFVSDGVMAIYVFENSPNEVWTVTKGENPVKQKYSRIEVK